MPDARPLQASTTAPPTVRYKNDGALRRRLFTPESMVHPAKGHLGMWEDIIQRYTQLGETILDPMAGVGSTLLAALMGRNVVCVELEEHFVSMLRANWEKARQHPMLGYLLGNVSIIHGDARNLSGLLVDAVVTSPPWADKTALQNSQWLYEHEVELADKFRRDHAGEKGLPGNKRPLNRKTMEGYTRPVDAVITSPPWQNVDAQVSADKFADPQRFADSSAKHYHDGTRKGHAASKEAILRHLQKNRAGYTRPVDAMVTSPPFQEQQAPHKLTTQALPTTIGTVRGRGYARDGSYTATLTGNMENIGNQKGAVYWDSMRQVYGQCYAVLKPGGVMALVVKGFTRDGKYVDLPSQTGEMCESLGFILFDRWARELWSLSFWRVLQKRRDPAAFDERLNYEEVLAFRKPADAAGPEPAVDCVLTSPPYEGIETPPLGGSAARETDRSARSHAERQGRGYTRPQVNNA